MTKAEFKERIKGLALSVYSSRQRAEEAAVEYDELTKFPELKEVILSLLTSDFNNFLSKLFFSVFSMSSMPSVSSKMVLTI